MEVFICTKKLIRIIYLKKITDIPNPVNSIFNLIGNTPILNISKFNNVNLFAKLEGYNIGGSIKDRIAYNIIESAEKNGLLTKDKIILEASSGNTAIGLSMVAAVKGYQIEIVLNEDVSFERKRILQLLGAKLIFSPKEEGTDGDIRLLQKIYSNNPNKYFLTNQYSNPINLLTHYHQTSKEIINQLPDITHLFVGVGTSGTAVGLSKALKECNPNIKTIAVEPEENHKIFGLKNMYESIIPKIYTKKYFDKIETAYTKETYSSTKELIRERGLLVGISSGAVYSVAKRYIDRKEEGNYLMVFPDRFERYASISF